MAPNRKQLHHLDLPSDYNCHVGLEGLRSTVQSKYLPLTDPRSQQQLHLQQQEDLEVSVDAVGEKQEAVASYWEWPTEAVHVEENAEVEEAIPLPGAVVIDLFSASHLEANLIAASQNHNHSAERHEDETDVVKPRMIVPQHHKATESYWDWSADPVADEAEELAQRLTSSAHLIYNLKTPKASQRSEGRTVLVGQEEHHGMYWTWEAQVPPTPPHHDVYEDPNHPLHDYWTWHFSDAARHDDVVSTTIAESDEYWEWNTAHDLDALCHEPWVDGIVTARVSVTTGKSYWDW